MEVSILCFGSVFLFFMSLLTLNTVDCINLSARQEPSFCFIKDYLHL